nr:MAG TPA: hypothetical protein [Caudoviricetes sp.]
MVSPHLLRLYRFNLFLWHYCIVSILKNFLMMYLKNTKLDFFVFFCYNSEKI